MCGCYVESGVMGVGRVITLGQSRWKLTVLRPIRGDQGVRDDEEDMMEVLGWADV